MYFAGNFSELNYTYTIFLTLHLKIINVDSPKSRFSLTPPPLASLYGQRRGCLAGLLLPPQPPSEGARVLARVAGLGFGKGLAGCRPSLGLSVIVKGLCCLLSQRSFPRNKQRNRLPETQRFHLGLKVCLQVHRGLGRMSGRGIKALVRHLDPLGFDTRACLHLPRDVPVAGRLCQKTVYMLAVEESTKP